MKSLPLIAPAGCTLSSDGLAEQLGRAARLAAAAAAVSRSRAGLRVAFAPEVDGALVDELIVTEQACCSFLDLEYQDRVLRIESGDPRGPEVIDRLAAYFGEGR
jgi:hypothetical protein